MRSLHRMYFQRDRSGKEQTNVRGPVGKRMVTPQLNEHVCEHSKCVSIVVVLSFCTEGLLCSPISKKLLMQVKCNFGLISYRSKGGIDPSKS